MTVVHSGSFTLRVGFWVTMPPLLINGLIVLAEVSSMVAGLCYAWFLENTIPKVTGDTWHAVPVIDMPRHYMHKRKDAAWLFDACGIDAGALLFSDEVCVVISYLVV